MNRSIRAARTLARTKTGNRPRRLDAGLWRHHFADGPLPFWANLVAIIAGAVDSPFREFGWRHRRIFRKRALGREQGLEFFVDFLLAGGVEKFFSGQEFFIQRN